MLHADDAQLLLERVEDVADGCLVVVFEGFRLSVLEKHLSARRKRGAGIVGLNGLI